MFEARRRRMFIASACREIDRLLAEVGEDTGHDVAQDIWVVDYEFPNPSATAAGKQFGLWVAHCIHERVSELQVYCGNLRLLCVKDVEIQELVAPNFILAACVIRLLVESSRSQSGLGGVLCIPCKDRKRSLSVAFKTYRDMYLQITGFND